MADPAKPAAQYLRMSTDMQRYSLANQAAVISEYARTRNLAVVRSYEDAGRSGVTATKREGLKALLRDVMSGDAPFATILVVDVSRWGRFQDPDEAAHYEFICREQGVSVEYCSEPFDNDGSSSAAILKALKRVMAGEYSRQLATRVRDGKLRQMGAGCHSGGRAPYGLRRQAFNADGTPDRILGPGDRRSRLDQTVRLVRGPDEEVIVTRAIFSLFVKRGWSISDIARRLNDRGAPCSLDGPWTTTRVRSVLTNELAIGQRLYNRVRRSLLDSQSVAPPSEWRRAKILDPVVSAQMFEAAQRRLAELTCDDCKRREMLARLKAFVQRHGGRVTFQMMKRAGLHRSTYVRHFGSMETVWKLIDHTPRRRRRRSGDLSVYTREHVVARLKTLLAQHGYLSSAVLQVADDLPSSGFISRQFGGLFAAYRAAGFEVSPEQALKAAWLRRGRTGGATHLGVNPPRCAQPFEYEREHVLARLRALLAEHGYLSVAILRSSKHIPSTSFIGRQFGGMFEAYKAAGYVSDRSDAARAAWLRPRRRSK